MAGARSLADLVRAGLVAEGAAAGLSAVTERYAVGLTPFLVDRLAGAPAGDPLAVQYIPSPEEAYTAPEERMDPIGDDRHSPVPGIVHRYPDRVLLKPLHACAVYCRFCFRRESVGPGGEALSEDGLARALAYVRAAEAVWEVIVTGGDPFLLAPRRVAAIVRELAAMPHVEVVRFHTRVPVADPPRVTPALVAALRAEGIASWVAVHANHPAEFAAEEAAGAVARLADAGVPLVGQTVLLKGVNDDPAVLAALFRAMVRHRIKPYYLHHPDLAPGTGRFRPAVAEGRALVEALRGHVSGLCQPRYVLDIPDGHGKVSLETPAVTVHADGTASLRDRNGVWHRYADAGSRIDEHGPAAEGGTVGKGGVERVKGIEPSS